MGQAKAKRVGRIQATIEEIEKQEGDLVQVPLQESDGCFRGLHYVWMNDVLDYWQTHANGRTLWIYRIDKFWVQHYWETKGGHRILRHEEIVEVRANQELRDMWIRTMSQSSVIDKYREQIAEVKGGESGHVVYWAFLRYVMAHSKELPFPINCWDYFPIVEVHHPDGRVEESAIDVSHFSDRNLRTIRQDPKTISAVSPWEKRLFNRLITAKEIKE